MPWDRIVDSVSFACWQVEACGSPIEHSTLLTEILVLLHHFRHSCSSSPAPAVHGLADREQRVLSDDVI